eukprot:767425-Hanusia_phi.AAC.1
MQSQLDTFGLLEGRAQRSWSLAPGTGGSLRLLLPQQAGTARLVRLGLLPPHAVYGQLVGDIASCPSTGRLQGGSACFSSPLGRQSPNAQRRLK